MSNSLVLVFPYILPSVVTIILTTGIVFYVQRYYNSPMARGVAYMCVSAGVWAFARLCGLLSIDATTNLWWGKFEFFGIVSVPVAWLYFALHYTNNREYVTRRNMILMWLVPATTLLLVWTNDRHHLVWQDIYLETIGDVTAPASSPGPWFWVHTAYSYVLMLSGVVLVFSYLVRAPGLFRAQSVLPTLALLVPFLVNIATLAGWLPRSLDMTSSAFGISALLLAWDISRFRLLSLAPIARRVVFDSIMDSVLVLDWQNRLVDLNPSAANLLQIDFPGAVGEPIDLLLKNWGSLLDFCLAETFGEIELNRVLQDGSERWYSIQTTPIYGHEPSPNGRLIVLHDITVLKENEQALSFARDQAMKADEFKTQLLAKVSHELRTPLSVIHSYVELLKLDGYRQQSERHAAAVATIQENTRQLTKLVNDLLDAAQLEHGKVKMECVPFSPLELAKIVYQQFIMRAEAKRLGFDYRVDPALPLLVTGDFHRLRQIVANLVDNAIKYSDSGQIEMQLTLAAPDKWQISISDQGRGIPTEAKEMIFEPFQVLNGSSSGRNASYGLGLSIVKQLVTIMQGEVKVESEVSKGTTFSILLPLNLESVIDADQRL